MGEDDVDAAYGHKLATLKRIADEGVHEALKKRGAVRWNQKEIVGRDEAEALQKQVLSVARESVTDLASIHAQQGTTDHAAVVERIRTQFVDRGLTNLPGAGLYTSSHGLGGLTANGAEFKQRAEAQFNVQRDTLRREVEDIVTLALAEARRNRDAAETVIRAEIVKQAPVESPRKSLGEQFSDYRKNSIIWWLAAGLLSFLLLITKDYWARWFEAFVEHPSGATHESEAGGQRGSK